MRRVFRYLIQTSRQQAARVLGALVVGLALSACGGGNAPLEAAPGASGASLSAAPLGRVLETGAADEATEPGIALTRLDGPGLVAGPIDTIDTGPAGSRVVRAIGALAGGGHAVVWAALQGDDTVPPADPAWTLWVQAYDRHAAKVGSPAMLDIGARLRDLGHASAVILPEGRVAVGYLTEVAVPPGDPEWLETAVHTTQFGLDGSVRNGPRLLDSAVFIRYNPRANRLGGPITMALGQDGSYLVGWRFNAGSYFGRQPAFRVQRLAADTEPLGWIQHLDRSDLFGSQLAFDRLRLTMLDEGGWVASFTELFPKLSLLGRVVQNEVPRPLHIPEFGTLAPGSWVLDLRRHGSVLFADRHSFDPSKPLAPYSMHFNRLGVEQDPVQPLPAIPTTAAALRGGDYVALWSTDAGTFNAQRYTPRGRPLGDAFTIGATAAAQVTELRRGGMALAWVETSGTSSRIVTQRFDEPAAP